MKIMTFTTIFLTISAVLTTATDSSHVYQLANSDLLKGVLLGAIIASQQQNQNHNRTDQIPHPILDIIQKTMAGRIGAEDHQMDSSEPKAVTEKFEAQIWSRTAVTPNYVTKPMSTASESPIYSSQSLLAPTSSESTKPINPLSLPLQSMIVMLLPSRQHESSILDAIQKHMIVQMRKNVENQSENIEPTVKTNAINIGAHAVDPKGWKPVPINDNSNIINANKRFGRPYIEKSDGYLQSFGRR